MSWCPALPELVAFGAEPAVATEEATEPAPEQPTDAPAPTESATEASATEMATEPPTEVAAAADDEALAAAALLMAEDLPDGWDSMGEEFHFPSSAELARTVPTCAEERTEYVQIAISKMRSVLDDPAAATADETGAIELLQSLALTGESVGEGWMVTVDPHDPITSATSYRNATPHVETCEGVTDIAPIPYDAMVDAATMDFNQPVDQNDVEIDLRGHAGHGGGHHLHGTGQDNHELLPLPP